MFKRFPGMSMDSHDPRIKMILQLVSQLTGRDRITNGEAQNRTGDNIDWIIEDLTAIVEQHNQWRLEREEMESRANDLIETMVAIASQDFTGKTLVAPKGDAFDVVEIGLTAIVEELEASTVSKNYLFNVMNSMLDSIIITNLDGNITMLNLTACYLLGYQESELVGQPINKLFVEQFKIDPRDMLGEFGEREIATKAGRHIPVSCSMAQLQNNNRQLEGFIFVAQDITERKEAAQQLAEREALFRALFEQSAVGMVICDVNGHFEKVNQSFCDICGYAAEELMTLDFRAITYPDDLLADIAQYQALLAKEVETYSMEKRYIRKDGTIIWVNLTVSARRFGDQVLQLVGIVEEISERKAMRAMLETSEERLRQALRAGKIGIFDINEMTESGYFSPEYRAVYGWDMNEEVTLDKLANRVHPDDHHRIMESLKRSRDPEGDGVLFDLEYRILDLHGVERWLSTRSRTFFEGDGDTRRPVRSIGAISDITERKKIEDELRQSEFFLQKSQAVGKTGSYYLDIKTGKWVASPMLDEILGIDDGFSRDVEGWISLVHPDQKEEMLQHLSGHVLAKHNRFDKEYRIVRHNDQQERWVHGLGELEYDGHGNTIKMIGTIQDITERKQTETILMESQQRFSKIFHSSPIAISLSRLSDNTIVDINEAGLDILGYNRDEIIGASHLQLGNWGGPVQRWQVAQEFRENGRVRNREIQVQTKSGESRILLISIELMNLGGEAYLLSSSLDISERKRVEEALRQSESHLSLVFNNTSDLQLLYAVEHDSRLRLVSVNEAYIKTALNFKIDVTAADLVGKYQEEIANEILRLDSFVYEQESILVKQVIQSGKPSEYEQAINTPGGVFSTIIKIIPVLNEDGICRYVLWTSRDITARKQAEEALRRSEARFRVLVENSPDNVTFIDQDYRIEYMNKLPHAIADSVIGAYVLDFAVPEYLTTILATFERVLKTGEIGEYVVQAQGENDSIVWVAARVVPIFEEGKPAHLMLVSTDITERKRQEEALQKSESRFRALVENSPDFITFMDNDYRVKYINRGSNKRSVNDIVGTNIFDFILPKYVDLAKATIETALKAGKPGYYEYEVYAEGGGSGWLSTRVIPLTETGEIADIMLVTTDINEYRRTEAALRISEARLREAQSVAHIGNWDWNLVSNELFWSDELYRIFGLDERKVTIDVVSFMQRCHPDDAECILQAVNRALQGEGYAVDHRILLPDGRTRYVQQYGVVNTDESGTPIRFFGTTQDITDQKVIEQSIRNLNDELEDRVNERTQELQRANEEIRHFAYIVSHDLRAPLVNLKGFSGELRTALKVLKDGCDEVIELVNPVRRDLITTALEDDIPEALRFIESSVSNMDSFTKAILKLSRLGRLQLDLVKVDVGEIVRKALDTLSHQIKQREIKVTVSNLPVVTADEVSMEQIVGNILSNAVTYMALERPGEINITAEQTSDEVIFRIRDNGRGIASEDMDKVFAPFRRAGKQDTPGEGMGMAYVQTLVRRHGGRIWCESELGVGTTFTFTIIKNLTKDSMISWQSA